MEVAVLQFLRPNGRERFCMTSLPDDCQLNYQAMVEAGCRFEAEELTTGDISIAIADPDNDEDVNVRVSPNGPGVQSAMEEMLKESFSQRD